MTVNGAVTATQAVASTSLTQNHAATSFTPVTGSGGTAPLTYAVSPGPAHGVELSTPATGAITGTPTVASSATIYAVTVTDANSATATAVFSLTVNGAVTATQAVASASLTQNHAATPFTPVTGSGGTAPLTYSVSPPLPTGLALNPGTGAITGTPSVASPATTYTVTVTDASSATATAAFSLTVNGAVTATQAVASTSLTQNHAATPFTPVTGSGGTGPLTYAVSPPLPTGLSSQPGHGRHYRHTQRCKCGHDLHRDRDRRQRRDGDGTFILTVNGAVTATQAVASASLTQNHAATPFTPVTGSGGTAPLTYAVSPGLPTGLSLSPATGAITGMPAVASSATTYTVTVTDANGGTATATFSLTVNSPAPTITSITPSSGSTAGGTVVTITGTNFTGATSVTFGGVAASFTVVNLTTITATTPAGAAGTASVLVTTPGGTNASNTLYTYVTAPVAGAVTANVPFNSTANTITLNITGGTAASITITTPPGHGTTSVSGTTVTYTPTTGYSGVDSFQYTASNAGGTSPAATVTISVNKAVPTIAVRASQPTAVFGVPVTLTATIAGGSSPTGTVTFKDGSTTLGTAPLSGNTATFTTSSLSSGTHSIVAVYNGDTNNAPETSVAASVSVSARPNPALNADVVGLVAAETSTATRYGQTQLNNAEHRLEEMHDDDEEGAPPDQYIPQNRGPANGSAGGASTPLPYAQQTVPQSAGGGEPVSQIGAAPTTPYGGLFTGAGQPLPYADMPNYREDSQNQTGRAISALSGAFPTAFDALNKSGKLPFHIWYTGSIDFGNLNSDGTYNNRFTSSGLTVGLDHHFAPGFAAGIAFGTGLDHTAVGTDGTKSDLFAYNATIYASYRALPHTFLDVIAGYGRMSFTLDRWSTDASQFLAGHRNGSDAFGSISITQEIKWGDWKFSPYGRMDVVRVDLAAYSETGSSIWDLSYNNLTSTTLVRCRRHPDWLCDPGALGHGDADVAAGI